MILIINASYRIFESLLYRSEFYNKQSQSLALWITNNDERPFCLSTLRLEEINVLNLPILLIIQVSMIYVR